MSNIRSRKAELAWDAFRKLLFIAGGISVIYSGSCLLVVGFDLLKETIGSGWLAFSILAILAYGFCYLVDFYGIMRVWGFSVGELSRWALAPSTVTLGQRIVAGLALLVGGAFVAASGLTSYYASQMAAGVVSQAIETPKEAVQAEGKNKEYEKKLTPYRARLDSLQKAKSEAIEQGKSFFEGESKWRQRKMDSVATSKEKIFAPQILAAQKSLEQAEHLHGKLFSQTSQVLMDNATAKLSAVNAKNSALWAILFMFGLGAILIEAVITAIIAFMEVNATCQIERAFAKAVQKSDALDGIGAGYGAQPSGAQTPSGSGKRQGGVRPPSPSGSGRKNGAIPFDIEDNRGLFN